MVSPIFHARDICGCHQIMGNASGPTERSAMMMTDFRKYHGNFSSAVFVDVGAFKNSPQCLHFIAAS